MIRFTKSLFFFAVLSVAFVSCEQKDVFTEIYLVKVRNASLDYLDNYGDPVSVDTFRFVLDGTIDTVPGLSGKKYDFGTILPGKESDFIQVKPGKYAIIVNDTILFNKNNKGLKYWLVTEANLKCIFPVIIRGKQKYDFWRPQIEMMGQPMIVPY